MEKSLTLLENIKKEFQCEEQDIRSYSPLTLAYIGDCIYEIIIRTVVVERGNKSPQSLHKTVTKYVKAETQCELFQVLQDELTEEEMAVMRRGRNAKSFTTAKNASVGDYRKASGLEALFGFLYLTGQTERAVTLLKSGLAKIGMEI
ncbi:MAG: Mini-ribonuclease 3 [Lachnospiraceae bacterium]